MLRFIFLTIITFTLHAFSYPKPYEELAGPLFKARINLDDLVYQAMFRQHILSYEAHSDRVLGHYRLIQVESDPQLLEAYHQALVELKHEYDALERLLHKQLTTVIANNQYPIFLKITSTLSDEDYNDPYLREKIYTYYQAHRQEEVSSVLDNRIQNEWDTIAHYYPKKALFNYTTTDNAYYREVVLITIELSPYGARISDFFKQNHVKFTPYDFTVDEEGKKLFEKYNGNRIPMVIINNRVVEGYNEYEMDRLLRH
jgi:hypothetical protein